ncbi:hypothetical protein FLAVO9AF_290041 [Flavobacterium sp. 9AF]|nr:hypothetical protein FLAVO9AF_290041 [Flavobacterium sp. 9AF]
MCLKIKHIGFFLIIKKYHNILLINTLQTFVLVKKNKFTFANKFKIWIHY